MDSERPLTIMHILEPGGGGTMRHVLDLAGGQTRAGHRVHLVYSPLRLEALFTQALEYLKGVTLHTLPMRRAPHRDDIKNIAALIKLLRTIGPDILHAHSTKAGMIARLARLFFTVPVIYTPHGIMTCDITMPRYRQFIYKCYERLLAPLLCRLIVLSRQEYDCVAALGIAVGKISMGVNGIAPLPRTDRAAVRATWNIMLDQITVGFVGRFAYPKNPQLVIKAFALAARQLSQLSLIMVGDGPDQHECRILAQTLGIASRIVWLGAVDARRLYQGLDMLIIPSVFEGMAYTFIEALHAGVPVIATPVGGSDRCVIDGQTGFIVPRDAGALAEKILQLAGDSARRDKMQCAARIHAQHFTLAHMLTVHEAIYHECLTPP